MILAGQTPLASLSLPQDQIGLLRSLWIETAEEAIAMAAAFEASGQHAAIPAMTAIAQGNLCASVSPERLALLRQPSEGGGLGLLLDPQAVEVYQRDGRLRSPGPLPAGVFDSKLPRAVRLFDRMPPVRDQGQRGTCVAFASVALREYLLPKQEPLSEQFTYWGCKELDGQPGAGTYIHTAMTVFAQYGVCPESVWHYNPRQKGSEGQGPPPPSARDAAQPYRLPSARTVESGLVPHYKHILAGEDGVPGMPITFGVLVFDSWYRSAETRRTGKITLPLPGETHAGGHAMCVVGYVDDEGAPGGGYFIVRNSWGAEWASESPEAPGHALMPYEYVESYAMDAFTGPLASSAGETTPEYPEWRDYIRVLDKDGRDVEERLLKRGTRVIAHPRHPDAFFEDTPENRQRFLLLDRAWTPEARQSLWFPARRDWPAEFTQELAHVQAAREAFFKPVEENLKTSVGTHFPDVNLPSLASLLPWQPTIRRFSLEADLSAELASDLLDATGRPPEILPPKEWEDVVRSTSGLRVYRLLCVTADVRVVAAFLAPVGLHPGKSPAFVPPTASMLQSVQDLVANRLEGSTGRKPVYTFFSFGATKPWPEDQKALSAGDQCMLLSHKTCKGVWHTLVPPFYATRISFRDFLDRVQPVTRQERISRVKTLVDGLLAEGYQANITVDKIVRQTGYRQTSVRDAFIAMQEVTPEKYRVQRLEGGQIAIRPSRVNEPVKLTAASFRRGPLRKHGLLFISAAVGVSGFALRSMVKIDGFAGFLLLVSLVYFTGLIQTQINRRASDEKD